MRVLLTFAVLSLTTLVACGDDDDPGGDARVDARPDSRPGDGGRDGDGARPDVDTGPPDARDDADAASDADASFDGDPTDADAASDADASSMPDADASDDASVPTSCADLVELDNGDPCEGTAYCTSESDMCTVVRCLLGVVGRANTCDDAGMCEDVLWETSCESDFECAVAWEFDCCGGASASGIRQDQLSTFSEHEARCAPAPLCECLPRYTIGGDTEVDPGRVVARCFVGQCQARERGCAGDGECGMGQVCCYPCGIPGCENRCMEPCTGSGCAGGCPLIP